MGVVGGTRVTATETSRFVLSGSVLTHPVRGDAAARVAAQAPPGVLSVVTDPDPTGPPTVTRTALAAWESVPPSSTHHLVVQDDMILADGLFDRVRHAIETAPDAALALFSLWDSRNGAAVRLGALSGARWVGAVNEYTPSAALVLPRDIAAGYVDYVRRHPSTWPDDILMQRYLRSAAVACFVSVPNLAEHEDVPSIAGNVFRGPRRSACYLPFARPGREAHRLSGLAAVPFFKNGMAQCVVRLRDTAPARWLHLETVDYLRGLGVPARHLEPQLGRDVDGLDPALVRGTWLTAYTLGMLSRGAPPETDPDVTAEALDTIAPGGMSHDSSAALIDEVRDRLATVACRALLAGREADLRPRRFARGITVLGAEGPFGEHLVRTLTDLGHPVTMPGTDLLHGGGTGARRAGDVVVDLRELAAAGPVLISRGRHEPLPIDPGHLYGPGCAPDSVIGAMVWAALQGQAIVIADDAPDVVRPRHVRELAELVHAGAAEGRVEPVPTPSYPVRVLAEIIAQVVRPVPVHDGRAVHQPEPSIVLPGQQNPELRYRLHHFAQWLAYEFDPADPVTITRTSERTSR